MGADGEQGCERAACDREAKELERLFTAPVEEVAVPEELIEPETTALAHSPVPAHSWHG